MEHPIITELTKILKSKNGSPFLFIGSGFSRRYLGLEDWKGLLSSYCAILGKPYDFYISQISDKNDFPRIASLIAEDFNKLWWESSEFEDARKEMSGQIEGTSSAIKHDISNYLNSISLKAIEEGTHPYSEEITLLKQLNVDGIITTNWDNFLEFLFPDYDVYVGQNDLLFSNLLNLNEIYKIHGSITKPNSLIFSAEDYDNFAIKYPYLIAKLITIFIEHPIIFFGYSLSDENIQQLIKSISECLTQEQFNLLKSNLIFVQRPKNNEIESIRDGFISIGKSNIPITLVSTDNFSLAYKAIDSIKRKVPVKYLSYLQEQLYEIIQSESPLEKVGIINIDEIEQQENLEFIVGVGVAKQINNLQLTQTGYEALNQKDLFGNIFLNEPAIAPQDVISFTIKNLLPKPKINQKRVSYTPMFKWLSELNVTSETGLISYLETLGDLEVKSKILHHKNIDLAKLLTKISEYHKKQYLLLNNPSLDDILEDSCISFTNKCNLIPLAGLQKNDCLKLKNFIVNNFHELESKESNTATSFKRLMMIYDRIQFGW